MGHIYVNYEWYLFITKATMYMPSIRNYMHMPSISRLHFEKLGSCPLNMDTKPVRYTCILWYIGKLPQFV